MDRDLAEARRLDPALRQVVVLALTPSSTPVLNAASVFLMVGSGLLAVASILVQRRAPKAPPRPAAGIGEGIRTT